MINFERITGTNAQRLAQSTEMLENVFARLDHTKKMTAPEKLKNIFLDELPFGTIIKQNDNPKVCGYMSPCVMKGKYLGAKMYIPHDEFLNAVKTQGDDLDTTMHELGHATHRWIDPRITANEQELIKLFNAKIKNTQDPLKKQELANLYDRVFKLYEDTFYAKEIPLEKRKNFVEGFKKGGISKTIAIEERLEQVSRESEKILQELPDNELKLAALKVLRNGLGTENYAFAQGQRFRAQQEINRAVQKLAQKEGTLDELIELEKINPKAYQERIKDYFYKSGLVEKQQELNKQVEWNNDVCYMFQEKINFLNRKIANLIKTQRVENKKALIEKEFESWG